MLESLFNKAAGLRAPTKVFSCEICENFKNTFFYRIPPVIAHVTISSGSNEPAHCTITEISGRHSFNLDRIAMTVSRQSLLN